MSLASYELRELRPQDEPALAELVKRGFADSRREEGLWRWRFLEGPGSGLGRVLSSRGEIVGQFAAVGLPTWIDGREVRFAQAKDVVIDPRHRRGHEWPGLFLHLAREFEQVHADQDELLVTFAFPEGKMRELARILLRYETIRTQNLLSWDVSGASPTLPPEVHGIERFDHQARWLWERCCGVWGASTIRDDRFLNWRYVEAPGSPYLAFGVRDAEAVLRGLAVYRTGSRLFPGAANLVDWLVPAEEPEVGRLLFEAIGAQARKDRATSLVTLFPEWSPWFSSFQQWGALVLPSDLVLMARSLARRFDDLWLRENWWVQLGDTTLA